MVKKDYFVELAMGNKPVSKENVKKREPLVLEKKYFKNSSDNVEAVKEESYEDRKKQFKDKLNKLRKQYQSFLENYVPESELVRNRMDLKKFDFRYRQKQDNDFTRVLKGEGSWEKVEIPDYRGPVGKWTAYYFTGSQ